MPRAKLAAAVAAALLLPAALCVPAPPALQPVTRVAEYADIPGQYASVYKVVPRCPDSVRFGEPRIDDRQVALLPMSDIQEDGDLCTGPSPMAVLAEANLEREGQLEALQLQGLQDALDANPNAANLVRSSNTSMMVGWHAGERQCGQKLYPTTTIYFVIKEETPYRVSLSKPGGINDLLTIPPRLRSLLIVAPNNNICLLVERSTAPGSNPTVTTTFANGTKITTVLTDSGPSPQPSDGAQEPNDDDPQPSDETEETSPPAASLAPNPSPSLPATPPTGPPPVTSTRPSPSAVAGVGVPPPSTDGPDGNPIDPSAEPEMTAMPPQSGAGGADSPTLSPAAEPSEPAVNIETQPEDDGSACFPGTAIVTLEGGAETTMAALSIGDRVRVGSTAVSDVVFFTHRQRRSRHRFLRLSTASGRALTVSPGHYVYVTNGQLRAAQAVAPGDALVLADGRADEVRFVEPVSALGLYNPQTAGGDIVVDGFRASTYTTAVHPALAHGLLMAPVRWLYGAAPALTARLATCLDRGSPLFARLLPDGPAALAA